MIFISRQKKSVGPAEAAELYVSLGWGTSKKYSTSRMKRSLANCDIVVSARNENGELVGLVRALSDFAIDTKILDMVIDPDYQRQGLGKKMMRAIDALARGTTVYCETEPKNFGFAAACGYGRRKGLAVFRKTTNRVK
jgi:ribosomal protein S18 acetylase RimI-like enzyme